MKLKELRDKKRQLEVKLCEIDVKIEEIKANTYDEILSALLKELEDYQTYSDDYVYENVVNNTLCVLSDDARETFMDYI